MRQTSSLLALFFVLFACTQSVLSQSLSSQDRQNGLTMLKAARDDIRKNYFDPGFRGIDLDARTKQAEERIKTAKSNAEMFGIIAQVLLDFHDSHTVFLPPQKICSRRIWLADASVWRQLLRHRSQDKERCGGEGSEAWRPCS